MGGHGPVQPTSWTGYDGQFFYYMALDPQGAAPYMDLPGYRYQRIAYPMLARLIVLGRSSLIPDALLAVNLFAVVAGSAALADQDQRGHAGRLSTGQFERDHGSQRPTDKYRARRQGFADQCRE